MIPWVGETQLSDSSASYGFSWGHTCGYIQLELSWVWSLKRLHSCACTWNSWGLAGPLSPAGNNFFTRGLRNQETISRRYAVFQDPEHYIHHILLGRESPKASPNPRMEVGSSSWYEGWHAHTATFADSLPLSSHKEHLRYISKIDPSHCLP